jgi:arylsulfatase A-like enzyme
MRRISRRRFLRLVSSLPLASLLSERSPTAHAMPIRVEAADPLPNILVIVFDTLSAKHMSLYGYPRETTPDMDRLARRATVYHRHYSSCNYTSPSTASMLTGTLPWTNRVYHLAGTVIPELASQNPFRLLSDRGYETVAYTHNPFVEVFLDQFRAALDVHMEPEEYYLYDWSVNRWILKNKAHLGHHLHQHLLRASWIVGSVLVEAGLASLVAHSRRYQSQYPGGVPNHGVIAYLLNDAIEGTVSSLSDLAQPFFGYFHYYPPHHPYVPPRQFIGMFDDGWAPPVKPNCFMSEGQSESSLNERRREYDEYIAYVDTEFGRLCDQLEQAGLLDNTYVFVTSDHGELFERGIWGHSNSVLYEPLLHVPLIVLEPGQSEGRSIYQPTSCVDLLPTWLHLAGAPIPSRVEGQVLPGFGAGAANRERSLYALVSQSSDTRGPLTNATIAMMRRHYKLIHYLGYEECERPYELYDLENDPDELENLYASHRPIASELARELGAQIQQVNCSFEAQPD